MKNTKFKFLALNILITLFLGIFLLGDFNFVYSQSSSIIPCGEMDEGFYDCDYNKFIELINNIIDYIFSYLILPICVVMFSWSGFLFLTSGDNASKRSMAKNVFSKVGLGLAISLGAWLLVEALLDSIGLKESYRLF